jgi:hypothetical protein
MLRIRMRVFSSLCSEEVPVHSTFVERENSHPRTLQVGDTGQGYLHACLD